MQIKWKFDRRKLRFKDLVLGDVFRAEGLVDDTLFMKITTDTHDRSAVLALDLTDGVAGEINDYELVELVNAHIVED